MITHKEAEILTSARQDAPLDPVVERELQAHLATCDECRAFAIATERLTAGIKAMPSIPVNPRTRREVMEQVNRGRNPLAGLFAGFGGGGFQSGPIFAAAATLVIIGLVGWLALDRLVGNDGGNNDSQLAAVPTEQVVERYVASPTQIPATETPEPTDEPVPTETVAPTETAIPTDEPEPTATIAPTDEPQPTDEPVPTATSEPEVTADPTATSAPDDDGPTDLTSSTETESSDSEETQVTTLQQTGEPAATETPEPTATQEPTTVPEPTAPAEPTQTPEPTETPGIEPMDGSSVITGDGTGAADPTQPSEEETEGDQSTDEAPPIEPTDGDPAATQEPENTDGVGGTEGAIEPLDGSETEEPASPESEGDIEETPSIEGQSLEEASVAYSGIAGDPSGHLGLTPDGRLEFMQTPDGASQTTSGGFRLSSADAQPGVVHLCGDGYCEPALEAPESDSWQGDAPLGVMGDTVYFLRMYADRTEVFASPSDGTALYEAQVIAEIGPTTPPTAVYANEGVMMTWLSTGEWLEIRDGAAQTYSGGYTNPYNLRFAPLADGGPLVGYFSEGTLVIAPLTSPDQPVFTVPSDGVDFDMTGGGSRIAVISGSDIVIYDLQGNELQRFVGTDVQPGSLIWLNSGIVYVDRNTGTLYQIPETGM